MVMNFPAFSDMIVNSSNLIHHGFDTLLSHFGNVPPCFEVPNWAPLRILGCNQSRCVLNELAGLRNY